MFGFLFKRFAKATPSASDIQKLQAKVRASDDASALASEKVAAIATAQSFSSDEAAAIQFILQSRFADARLEAAAHVRSRGGLETLARAMRETDRRVARLAQQRLDAIRQQEAAEREALACLERIDALAGEPIILPNQFADIERAWSRLDNVPPDVTERFQDCCRRLQQRLLDQTTLQQNLIELRAQAQTLVRGLEEIDPSVATGTASATLDALEAQFTGYRAAAEAPSLPKHLVSDSEALFGHARRMLTELAQRQAAWHAHERAYAAWEADADAGLDVAAFHRELRSLPPLAAQDAHLFDQRSESLQARIAKNSSRPQKADEPVADMATCRQTLQALETALDEGALQLASEREKALRAAESQRLKWTTEEAVRLAHARAELSRLKGWARWGGKVSREELIKTAEELPSKESSPPELAKKVGSLRSQWKSMDVLSGAAERTTWLRFDAACTAAYAPVAAYFESLAAERKANLEKAESFVAQVKEFADAELGTKESSAVDWKKIAAFRLRMRQAWREIGQIDRKSKKTLDKQFTEAMDALSGPLLAAQQEEMKQRERLIAHVAQLDHADNRSTAALRDLQQQWQERAKSLPLERKDEQAFWLRFRAACDEHFARRQAGLQVREGHHAENFRLKTALCERVESAAHEPEENRDKLLREIDAQWNAIGSASRAEEPKLLERYRHAVSEMRAKLEHAQHAARHDELVRIRRKLELCMDTEAAVCTGSNANRPVFEEAWRTSDPAPDGFERILSQRFQAALAALEEGDAAYAAMLNENGDERDRALLRLEISLEIESPSRLASERLTLQVEALQASLKSGTPAIERTTLLQRLCALPAFADAECRMRIQRLFDQLGASKN